MMWQPSWVAVSPLRVALEVRCVGEGEVVWESSPALVVVEVHHSLKVAVAFKVQREYTIQSNVICCS